MQFSPALSHIIDKYKNFILDIYGVVHNGVAPFKYTLEFLRYLQKENKNVVLLTNSPRPRKAVAQKLTYMNINDNMYQAIITSGDITKARINYYQKQDKNMAYLLGSNYHQPYFKSINDLYLVDDVSDADFMIIASPFDDINFNYKKLLAAAHGKNLPAICANPDLTVIIGNQEQICAGNIANLYTQIGGKVEYIGKPYQQSYQWAKDSFAKYNDYWPKNTIAFGDSLHTDITGAVNSNLDSALVLTGVQNFNIESSNLFDHIKQEIKTNGVEPTYIIKNLAL